MEYKKFAQIRRFAAARILPCCISVTKLHYICTRLRVYESLANSRHNQQEIFQVNDAAYIHPFFRRYRHLLTFTVPLITTDRTSQTTNIFRHTHACTRLETREHCFCCTRKTDGARKNWQKKRLASATSTESLQPGRKKVNQMPFLQLLVGFCSPLPSCQNTNPHRHIHNPSTLSRNDASECEITPVIRQFCHNACQKSCHRVLWTTDSWWRCACNSCSCQQMCLMVVNFGDEGSA